MLVESIRSMLKVTPLSTSFWAEAVAIARYLQNYSFTSALKIVTPYEL